MSAVTVDVREIPVEDRMRAINSTLTISADDADLYADLDFEPVSIGSTSATKDSVIKSLPNKYAIAVAADSEEMKKHISDIDTCLELSFEDTLAGTTLLDDMKTCLKDAVRKHRMANIKRKLLDFNVSELDKLLHRQGYPPMVLREALNEFGRILEGELDIKIDRLMLD
jgi:hypothetical protein